MEVLLLDLREEAEYEYHIAGGIAMYLAPMDLTPGCC